MITFVILFYTNNFFTVIFFLLYIIYQLNFLGYKVYFFFCSVSYKATNKEYSLNDKFTDWT